MTKQTLLLLLITVMVAMPTPAFSQTPKQTDPSGALHGKILYRGKKPSKKKVVMTDVIIYLEGDTLLPKPTGKDNAQTKEKPAWVKSKAVVLNQVDITFVPHVLPVVVATPVEFRNSDAILHNVHTNSKKNEPFSRLQAPAAAKIVHVFESPEVIHIGCDIHSQMSAYIVVVPNRFFTKASKNGAYTLKGVPPGTYKLVAWCEKYRTVSKTVEVKAGVTTQTDMDFQKKSRRAR